MMAGPRSIMAGGAANASHSGARPTGALMDSSPWVGGPVPILLPLGGDGLRLGALTLLEGGRASPFTLISQCLHPGLLTIRVPGLDRHPTHQWCVLDINNVAAGFVLHDRDLKIPTTSSGGQLTPPLVAWSERCIQQLKLYIIYKMLHRNQTSNSPG